MIKNKTGVWGEIYAARYLRDRGFKILCSDFICRHGEIDIIAEKNNVICFVEVKTRNKDSALRPMEAVDNVKQTKMITTAEFFISRSEKDSPMRFDVCEVYVDDDDRFFDINYIESAFYV